MTDRRHLLPLALVTLSFLVLVSGCCEDCECPTEPTPVNHLIGTWECVSYLLNGETQAQFIGSLMTFNRDGTGHTGVPGEEPVGEFTWSSTESKLFIEEESMGLATAFDYTASADSLSLYAEVLFIGPMMTYEMGYIRWEE